MKAGKSSSQNDTCLERFTKEWNNQKNSIAERAKILRLEMQYVKKLYSLSEEWRESFKKRVAELEKTIPGLALKDFEKVSKVIADARRALKQVKTEYGSGFQRKPTGAERRKILKFQSPTALNGYQRPEPETDNAERDLVDLYLGDLDSDDDDE